jgi:membrane protein YqaA with SNARE-associated domain
MLRRLYEWVLNWANTPYGVPALVLLALMEASFFPIPPDVLLLALALSVPEKSLRYAAWCTLGSVVGGVLGYAIGMTLWSSVDQFIFEHVFAQAKFDKVMEIYRDQGVWVVFTAAFTPIPFKVFTVTAGVAKLDLFEFIAASAVGRGARFFLVAGIVRMMGARAKEFIDRYFNILTIVAVALLLGGIALLQLRH